MMKERKSGSLPTPCETTPDGSSCRPSVLYIDRYYDSPREDSFAAAIAAALRNQYDIECRFDMGPWAVDLVQSRLATNPFAAIITHVPNDSGQPSYGQSIDVLHRLKLAAEIPIIAYTGATGMVRLSIWQYTDCIVEKSSNIAADAKQIGEELEWRLRLYKDRPLPQPPEIEQADGRTTVRARVHLNGGIDMSAAYLLAKECQSYPGRVTLESLEPDHDPIPYNCKEILGLAQLLAIEGAEMLLTVEGIGPAAEKLTCRLYGGLTSRYTFDMKWDRFMPSQTDSLG